MGSPVNGTPQQHEREPGGDTMTNSTQHPEAAHGAAGPVNTATGIPSSLRNRAVAARPPLAARAPEDRTVADLAWTLLERAWTVVTVAGVAVALAVLYLAATPPTYKASILVQVEGSARPVTAFQDVDSLFRESTPREGEMRIMTSRVLLEGIVAQLGLDVDVQPRTAPVIGAALARRWDGAAPAPPRLGLDRYAWGGERLEVARLTVSDGLVGERLTLVALAGGRYRVAADDGSVLVEGAAGEPATGSDGERSVELLVSALAARPGTEFTLVKRHPLDVVDELQEALLVSENGRGTGLVEVALAGPDPARTAEILNALSAGYVRQSVERTSAEAAKMLRVMEAQLPLLRSNLDKSERALNNFREKNGTVNVSLEAQAMLARLQEIDRAIAEDEVKTAESHRYTQQHPDLPLAISRTERLHAQRAALEDRMRRLPDLELQSMRLSRTMNAAAELYLLVLNRAEELRIVKSGWIGNARVLEGAAVPHRPVAPKPTLVIALAALLGLGAGVAAAFLRDAFGRGAARPDEIEAGTGLPVLASIPHSAAQRRLARHARRRPTPPLSIARPKDAAVEDLRGLRTSVQFALQHARNHVVGISGLAPGAGKSFVSMNLAHLLAAAGERVVLVETDLRRGGLDRYFGGETLPGLADILNGSAQLQDALRETTTPGLDLLPRGTLPDNPAELLAGDRLRQVLAELGARYEVVILDASPILAVSDSALVGRHAGLNLIVLRGGEHSVADVADAVKRLVRSGVTVAGAVLNDVRPSLRTRGGRSAKYRRYYEGSA